MNSLSRPWLRLGPLTPHLAARNKLRKLIMLGLPLFVCMRFQDLFHSPPGVLFAFPSRYWFTIGRLRVFSLGGWSPHLQTGFHVSRPTCRNPSSTPNLSRTGLSPLSPDFPDRSTRFEAKCCRLFPVRSPLLRESRLISVPLPT